MVDSSFAVKTTKDVTPSPIKERGTAAADLQEKELELEAKRKIKNGSLDLEKIKRDYETKKEFVEDDDQKEFEILIASTEAVGFKMTKKIEKEFKVFTDLFDSIDLE